MEKDFNISQKLLEQLEHYDSNTMESSERLAFEARLKADPEFKRSVDEMRLQILAIETAGMKSQLEDFHKELAPEPIKSLNSSALRRNHYYKYFAIAAMLIISLGCFWLLTNLDNDSAETLYTEYFEPDPGLATTMGSDIDYDFYSAMVDYKQAKYKVAIKKWETMYSSKPSNDTLNYFIGVAYLADGKEKEAIEYLKKTEENSSFNNDANYYLGMAYLKQGNVKEAKKYFNFSTIENSKLILSKLNE